MKVDRAVASAPVAQEPVAWAAVHFGGRRDGKIYTTCDTREQIEAYIQDVHRSSDSLTLRARPLAFADAPVAAPVAQESQQVDDAAVSAIQFALQADEGLAWLRCWNEGDFDACRKWWPDAPEECFIGADPLHPGTKAALSAAPVAQEPDATVVATAFRDRLINDLASLEDCYISRESIETAVEDVLHSFTALAAPVAAQAQPAMPPLTDAMRAVLRNEHCVYDSADDLYAALCDAAQDRADAPSLTNPLTPYGLLVRALRRVAGTTLMEMSEGTGYTPSYLSDVEFGRRPVTDGVIGCTWSFLEDKGIKMPLSVFRKASDRAAKGE